MAEPAAEPDTAPPVDLATGPPVPTGPRADRGLGAGVSLGFDGVAAVTLSWMSAGAVAVDFSVGVLFPVLDVRVRWFGLPDALTPVIGLGFTTPFHDANRLGGGLGHYRDLYAFGESVHVDLGAAWAITAHLDLFVGVAFVTPVDQRHPDTVLFFPEAAGQLLWYF